MIAMKTLLLMVMALAGRENGGYCVDCFGYAIAFFLLAVTRLRRKLGQNIPTVQFDKTPTQPPAQF